MFLKSLYMRAYPAGLQEAVLNFVMNKLKKTHFHIVLRNTFGVTLRFNFIERLKTQQGKFKGVTLKTVQLSKAQKLQPLGQTQSHPKDYFERGLPFS